MTPPLWQRITDLAAAARVLQSHARFLLELVALGILGAEVIQDVDLADTVETPIPHKLGRKPRFVVPSVVRTPFGAITSGTIIEYRDTFPTGGAPIDSTQIVVLAAFNYTSTIRVDVLVVP